MKQKFCIVICLAVLMGGSAHLAAGSITSLSLVQTAVTVNLESAAGVPISSTNNPTATGSNGKLPTINLPYSRSPIVTMEPRPNR